MSLFVVHSSVSLVVDGSNVMKHTSSGKIQEIEDGLDAAFKVAAGG